MQIPKPTRVTDQDYLEWIEGLACMICGRFGAGYKAGVSDAHHINKKGHGSMSGKTDDTRAVPLCFEHHREYHQHGRDTFAEKHDLDYEVIIDALNKLYPLNN